MADDLALLEAWREGDDAAGSRLFSRHFDAVYWFFRNKIDTGAEDLAQDTFLAIVRNRDSLADASSFRAYLFTTARSRLYDALRARQRRPYVDFLSSSVMDLGQSPTELLGQREEQRLLVNALRRLPVQMQVLVELRYFEQLSGLELAEVLDIPHPTVRSRLRRALEVLREQLRILASRPELVETTMSDLAAWAQALRSAGQGAT